MVKVSETKARQGRRGVRILVVLLVSLLLALLVWGGVEMYGDAIAPDDAQQSTGAQQGG